MNLLLLMTSLAFADGPGHCMQLKTPLSANYFGGYRPDAEAYGRAEVLPTQIRMICNMLHSYYDHDCKAEYSAHVDCANNCYDATPVRREDLYFQCVQKRCTSAKYDACAIKHGKNRQRSEKVKEKSVEVSKKSMNKKYTQEDIDAAWKDPKSYKGSTLLVSIKGDVRTATISCPNGYRRRSRVEGGKALFLDPPMERCKIRVSPMGLFYEIRILEKHETSQCTVTGSDMRCRW